MNLSRKQKIITWITMGVLAILCAWFFGLGPNTFRPDTVVLSGNTPDVMYHAQFLRHADPQKKMRVVVGLKLRNAADLQKLLSDQQDPNSPQFHQWLTPDQFTLQYGPTQSDLDQAVNYFKSQGLTVVSVSSNRVLIELEGSAQLVEKTFKVKINEYNLQNVPGFTPGIYYSNDHDPMIPTGLQGIVESVGGMSNFAIYHSRIASANANGQPPAHMTTPSGYSPQDIASAYNFPNINNSRAKGKYSGKGRTVAIATAGGYTQSDIDAFYKQFGIVRTGSIVNIPIHGTTTKTEDETTLDLETISSQDPAADVRMYIGADPEYQTFTLIFNQIVQDNLADVASVSWGSCEDGTGAAQMKTEQALFMQGNSQGIAFFASSGDDGAYDCATKKAKLSIDYPAADPYVTAVGGTSMDVFSGIRFDETAWSGSGGGISAYWDEPTWQTGKGVPQNKKRNTPDIAMNADPNTGYAIYTSGGWIQVGGTSVSAPDWASLWTLATDANGGRLGNANPVIYRAANSADYSKLFYDVTKGSNGGGRGKGYSATVGWDHTTGWGSPGDATALVDWVVKDAIQNPAKTPAPTASTDGNPPLVGAPHDGQVQPRH